MLQSAFIRDQAFESTDTQSGLLNQPIDPTARKPPLSETYGAPRETLMTVDDVAHRLNVSRDWVCYRAGAIEEFINERERLSVMHKKAR